MTRRASASPSPKATTGKAVAVTGGSGFVGGHLIEALQNDPSVSRIYVLDRIPTTQWGGKVTFHYVNINRPIEFVPPEPIHGCYHLAAICKEPGFEWNEYFETNYLGTRHVADWCAANSIDRVVFTSTAMVFKAGPDRMSEDKLPNPDTAYGISKALAEEVLHGWQSAGDGRHLSVLRPGAIFGKGAGGNFVNLQRSLKRKVFAYIGSSDTVKSCFYVKDIVSLLRTLMERDAPVTTVHGAFPQATTIKVICEAFCEAYGWQRDIPTVPLKAALAAATPLQMLNEIGIKNPVHRRRIEKLYYDTHLGSDGLAEIGFTPAFSVAEALRDWKESCAPAEIY